MGYDRPLHLAVLLPCWTLRMVLAICLIALWAIAVALHVLQSSATYLNYFGLESYSYNTALSILIVMVAFTVINLFFDITASILYCCHHLGRGIFLAFSILEFFLFTVVWILTIVGYEHSKQGGILALVTIAWIMYVIHLVYAGYMFWDDRSDGSGSSIRSGSIKEKGNYAAASTSEVFPNGQLPSSYSMSGAHPGNERPSHEAYA